MKQFNRLEMEFLPLGERYSKVSITEASVEPYAFDLDSVDDGLLRIIDKIADQILEARRNGSAVMCAFGAHAIKNGLGRVIGTLVKDGFLTHVCTNGAGIIHDWEFAYDGMSSEDVRANVKEGHFGTWQETGLFINLAITVGAYRGWGYARSVGRMIADDGILIPDMEELEDIGASSDVAPERRAAALDLIHELSECRIGGGFLPVRHGFKEYSVHPYINGTDGLFTCHPMFGHDVIYTHYANNGAAIGRTAERDFLGFVSSVSQLQGGVYLSVGSAVMSPMIFEKSLSMARNVLRQRGEDIDDFDIHVVDLQKATWDWNASGEPPMDDPAYYLRFMKTFNRMGGRTHYISCDNHVFLPALLKLLGEKKDG